MKPRLIHILSISAVGSAFLCSGEFTYIDNIIARQEESIRTMELVSTEVFDTLEKKCDGESYTFILKDFPGEIKLLYDVSGYRYIVEHSDTAVRTRSDLYHDRYVYSETNRDGFFDIREQLKLSVVDDRVTSELVKVTVAGLYKKSRADAWNRALEALRANSSLFLHPRQVAQIAVGELETLPRYQELFVEGMKNIAALPVVNDSSILLDGYNLNYTFMCSAGTSK